MRRDFFAKRTWKWEAAESYKLCRNLGKTRGIVGGQQIKVILYTLQPTSAEEIYYYYIATRCDI